MEKINDRLYVWGSDIEAGTINQAFKAADLSIIAGHVALMPDAHIGIGATVGSVIPTNGAIIPSAIGVDIGCGMIAVETNLTESQLPDLEDILSAIEKVVPAGVGQGHEKIQKMAENWLSKNNRTDFGTLQNKKVLEQFGTLGSGNHFFELCLDERGIVWIIMHSGSRWIGNSLATFHMRIAKELTKNRGQGIDLDLAYFLEGTPEFENYHRDMEWAQQYAFANRNAMMNNVVDALLVLVPYQINEWINCHHNYTTREVHDGKEIWVTRKGAIRAESGDLGVIPGSMGTRSYIVRGKGNGLSFNSSSHGAGRRMSRTEARKTFTTDDLDKAMEGKTWLKNKGKQLLDEIPASYKNIDQVMEDQKDLTEVLHTLHQIVNYKGTN